MTKLDEHFTTLPLKRISLYDCVWSNHDISPAHLEKPHERRDIDDLPVHAELLVSGHWFIHDGRHRCLRALSRGEHEIEAHVYSKASR